MPSAYNGAIKWYRSRKWRRVRKIQLGKQPFCQSPEHEGMSILANVVDHIKPHKGDSRLFWATNNLQSLCRACHDSWKRRLDLGKPGYKKDGTPVDPEHHWNKEG